MSNADWIKVGVDLLQAIISGVFVGLVIYWLDERRAKRERRLSDFRIASNWSTLKPKISLRNFDLVKSNLSGCEFAKADLERAIISDASIWATDFNEANLRYVDFRRSRIVGSTFIGATARGANFSKTVIRISNLNKAAPDFTGADLEKCTFIDAKLSGVIMAKANLTSADFSKTVILNCDFTEADLSGSLWRKVKKVENCIWKGVKVDNPNNFPKQLWKEIQLQNISPGKKPKTEK